MNAGGLGETVMITVHTEHVDRIAQIGAEIVQALRQREIARQAMDLARRELADVDVRLGELERQAVDMPTGTLYGRALDETEMIDRPGWLS